MARKPPSIHVYADRPGFHVVWSENGKQHWHTFSTRDEAENCSAREFARMRRGERPPDRKVTFRTAANRWHGHGLARGWRRSTAVDYRAALDVRLIPEFGDDPLVKLTEERVEEWLAELRDELSPRTVAKLLFVGSAVVQRAMREYGITLNPFRDVERGVKPEKPAMVVYTVEEVAALVRAAANDQEAAIILMAAHEGFRRGEIRPWSFAISIS